MRKFRVGCGVRRAEKSHRYPMSLEAARALVC